MPLQQLVECGRVGRYARPGVLADAQRRLDAAVIRCLILPAVMQLLGSRAWWLPGWLARRLPRVALEHA